MVWWWWWWWVRRWERLIHREVWFGPPRVTSSPLSQPLLPLIPATDSSLLSSLCWDKDVLLTPRVISTELPLPSLVINNVMTSVWSGRTLPSSHHKLIVSVKMFMYEIQSYTVVIHTLQDYIIIKISLMISWRDATVITSQIFQLRSRHGSSRERKCLGFSRLRGQYSQ